MAGRLSPRQVSFFRDEGYLLFDQPVLPPPKFDALKNHFEHKLIEFVETTGRSPEHFDVPHFEDLKLFDWLFDDAVLDVVESLIGPDIALWSSHFISKPAGVGKRVPWHEDSAYWGKVLDPMEVVTIWLAIDPSRPENGCMRVIPRTHHGGYSEYEPVNDASTSVFHAEIKAGKFDESRAVDCVLDPNHCSIHHAKLIHGSTANTSPMRRCGYTMRYVPATSRFRPDDFSMGAFRIYLARGQDRAGNTYGDPTKPNRAWLEADRESRRKAKLLAG
ncbi:MAG: phytanoyl-CoA dioxygenase family protein [Planctomycetota bacterium]|nr:phytanoyl-CoA dioxygenase family protein [Planctomycetota bacterium]